MVKGKTTAVVPSVNAKKFTQKNQATMGDRWGSWVDMLDTASPTIFRWSLLPQGKRNW